jgi:hypothetical protein
LPDNKELNTNRVRYPKGGADFVYATGFTGKFCTGCGDLKELSEYGYSSDGLLGKRQKCKPCYAAESRAYVSNNESYKHYQRSWRFGIPYDEYLKDLETIKPNTGTCELCGKIAKRIVLDHCHNSKKLRGWLCSKCNNLLGMSGDSVDLLKKAIEYIEKKR